MGTTKVRAFIAGFGISAAGGLMRDYGDLVTPVETDKTDKLSTMCPVCADAQTASPVKQQYVCSHDEQHGPFSIGNCAKGKEVEKNQYVLVDVAAVAEAKSATAEKNVLELQAYQRSEVEKYLALTGTSYVFRPGGRGTLYPILVRLLETRPDLVFVGVANIKDDDKFCIVDILAGQLRITQAAWPGDVREFAEPELPEIKASLLTMAEKVLTDELPTFDPALYVKGSRAKLAELISAAANGIAPTPIEQGKKAKNTGMDDLEAALLASLERKAS